ncbi:hypothetical protein AA313_de0204555 [Arthrobotrys entomopaga]|nr:hypothetical protein AA313_de0204555 [Arthrobotrys entomopaga]
MEREKKERPATLLSRPINRYNAWYMYIYIVHASRNHGLQKERLGSCHLPLLPPPATATSYYCCEGKLAWQPNPPPSRTNRDNPYPLSMVHINYNMLIKYLSMYKVESLALQSNASGLMHETYSKKTFVPFAAAGH